MSTFGSQGDAEADDGSLADHSSPWDEEWLPEWVNLDDDAAARPVEAAAAAEPADPELEQQLAADLEAVERLVASLLTDSSAAFQASVGGWEPDDPQRRPAPAEPAPDPGPGPEPSLSSVGFSLGIALPVPQRAPLPQQPPPTVPVVISPPAPRGRRLGWLVAPLVLLLAGAVVGSFLWAGSSRPPTPAAAVHSGAELSTSFALPTWSRPSGSSPTEPAPVTTAAPSASAAVTTVPPVHRAVRRAAASSSAHTSARPTVASPDLPAPTTPSPSPTGGSAKTPTCSSEGNTESTPAQTTEPTTTPTDTTTPAETTSPADTTTETTTATETTPATETTTATETETETETTTSQPSLASAQSCSNPGG